MDNSGAPAPDLEQDEKSKGVLNFFRNLPSNPQALRFFDRKDYYTTLGDNALYIAREFYKTSTVIKSLGPKDNTIPGVAINRSLFETVLREVLLEGTEHIVEVYEEVPRVGWKLSRSASPGKVDAFEEELFRSNEMADTPIVMAARLVVKDNQFVVGIAYANTTTRKLAACEFVDDEQFCSLEAAVVQIGAKECVVQAAAGTSLAHNRMCEVLRRCGALVSERKASDFSTKELESDLGRLLKGNIEHYRVVLERAEASASLAALLAFSDILLDPANHQRCTLELHDTGRYMRLDATALRALNVLKSKADANDSFSLYGLMNRARTPMGKRLLLRWLKQPLLDVAEISRRHDVVEAFADDAQIRDQVRGAQLRALPDIERIALKLERKRASLQDLCRLYQASALLPHIVATLQGYEGPHSALLQEEYCEALERAHDSEHLGKFEALLESAVDLERIPDEYVICATYDQNLARIQKDKDQVDAAIQDCFEDAAKELGVPKEKVLKLERSHLGHFFRLSKKEENSVRKKLQARFTTLEARKDGTKFTNNALRRLSEQRMEAERQYEAQQRQLVERVVEVASSFSELFFQVAALLAHLDILAGFAELSCTAPTPYVRPSMVPRGEGDLRLQACRHPCVEAQDGTNFIPNDCLLEHGKSWFQIITGPNMGGKSTFIRQVGVCVLMAQVGCFVPCDEAQISVRDAIFARVGAGDCQLRGVSTFMQEMLETASILKAATPASLVIIDELGRGTSTYDGFGLAWAISEHLLEHTGAPTLFATHFHELTALQGSAGVKNIHVTAHIDQASRKLTMLYAVREGACDESFGIHCAEFAKFPEAVLRMARAKAAHLESFAAPAPPAAEGAQPGAKRKRDATSSEAERARQFLRDFAALPLPELSPEAAVEKVQALKADLEKDIGQNANTWLQQLVASH